MDSHGTLLTKHEAFVGKPRPTVDVPGREWVLHRDFTLAAGRNPINREVSARLLDSSFPFSGLLLASNLRPFLPAAPLFLP